MFSIDHIALSVKNITESINFYKIFGFVKFNEWIASDKSQQMVMLKNIDNVYIELVHTVGSEVLPEHSKSLEKDLLHIGIKHFALRVSSVDETVNYIEKNGIKNHSEVLMGKLGRRYFFINDPNGILLEFIEKHEI